MKKYEKNIIIASIIALILVFSMPIRAICSDEEEPAIEYLDISDTVAHGTIPKEVVKMGGIHTVMKEKEYNPLDEYSTDEIDLFAKCVYAEAGNQGIDGMRLVACVILNHVDDSDYPNTITGVITRPGTFEVYSNGMMFNLVPSDEAYEAIRQELLERTDPYIYYFTAHHYGRYGTPAYKYKDHYFCYK